MDMGEYEMLRPARLTQHPQLGFEAQDAAIVRSRGFAVGAAGARSLGVQMCGARGVGGILRGQRHFSLFDIEEEDGTGEEEGEEEEEEDEDDEGGD